MSLGSPVEQSLPKRTLIVQQKKKKKKKGIEVELINKSITDTVHLLIRCKGATRNMCKR